MLNVTTLKVTTRFLACRVRCLCKEVTYASPHLCCNDSIHNFSIFSLRPDALRATQPPVHWVAAFLPAAAKALFRESKYICS
jgi:hypothetical protein